MYLILLAMTPAMEAAHRRWGLLVPAALAAGAVVVDTLVLVEHVRVLGYVNYILVWGTVHQMGFAWQDGTLTHGRRRLVALAAVSRANGAAMTVYLWHMAPVVVASVILYPTGLLPQPVIGSGAWWGLRAVWVVVLAGLFAPLVAALGPLERRRGRPRAVPDAAAAPGLAAPPPWALSLLGAGIPFVAYGLSRFAVRGFAPAGSSLAASSAPTSWVSC